MATIALAATSSRINRPRNCSTSSSSSSSSSTSSLSVFASSASFTQSRSSPAATRSRKRASWLSTLSEKPNWKDTAPQSVAVVDNDNVDDDARVPESPPSSPLPLNFGVRNFIDTDQESENGRRQGQLPSSLSRHPEIRKTGNVCNVKSPPCAVPTTSRRTASMPTGLKGQPRNPAAMETRPRFSVSTVVQSQPRIYGLGPSVTVSPSLSPSVVSSSRIVSAKTPSPSTRAKTTQTISTLTSSTVKESCVNPKVRSTTISISPGVSSPAKPTASSGNKFSKSRVTTTTTTTTRVASKTVTTAVRTEKNSSRKALTTPITTTAKITTTTIGSKAKDFGTKKKLATAASAAGCQPVTMSTKAGSLVTKDMRTTSQPPLTRTTTQKSKRKDVSPSPSLSTFEITPVMTVDRARTDASDEPIVDDTAPTPVLSSGPATGSPSLHLSATLLLPALEVDSPAPESLANEFDNAPATDVLPRIKTESPIPDNGSNTINPPPKTQRRATSASQEQTPLAPPSPCAQPFTSHIDSREDTSFHGEALAVHRSFKPTAAVSVRLSDMSAVSEAKSGAKEDPVVDTKSFQEDGISNLVDCLGIQEAIGEQETKSCTDHKPCRTQETSQLNRISIRAAMGLRPTESPLLKVRDPSAMNYLLKVMKDHRDASRLGLAKTPLVGDEIQKDTPSSRPAPPVVHTFLSRRSRAKAAVEALMPPSSALSGHHQHHSSNFSMPITLAAKQAYVHVQAQKRQSTSVVSPSRDLLRSWTTEPLKLSRTPPAVVLASPIAITASLNPLLDSGPSYMLHAQHPRLPPAPARSFSASFLNSTSLSGLSPRLTRPTLTMAGLSAFSSPRTSPGIKDSTPTAATVITPPRLRAQRSTSFLDTRTFRSDNDPIAPASRVDVRGDPQSMPSSSNSDQSPWSTCHPSLPITRIVVSQHSTRPGHLPDLQTPVMPVTPAFSTVSTGPEHDITLLTRRLTNIQLIDTLCPTTGMTTTTDTNSAIATVHSWMDTTWAMQIQQLLIHLSAQADLEAESKPRRYPPRYSDAQGGKNLTSDVSKGLFEQLLSDWIQRMDQLPLTVLRDHPGLKREVDKIRWQHDIPQKKIK